jgi:UDP-N-acetylglucosamine--N-acetylmuramyl-(pentapeptide) pyrophosphoryl-undecaprenol N-acetylglucosamine transferase
MHTNDKQTARKELGISPDATVVLSTGGSLGAMAINENMVAVLKEYADSGIVFIHGYGQNGKDMPEKLKSSGVDIENNKNLHVSEYIYDMAKYMAAADLVISRAGASSLAEIQVLGKASYLIPYPYAAENHQYHNAMALVNRDAAMVCQQKELSSEKLCALVKELSDNKEKFVTMGNNARAMAICNAKKQICDIVLSLID